jgi:hypothetical protein
MMIRIVRAIARIL